MPNTINEVIANALTDLIDEMPNLVQSIAKNGYFVTKVNYQDYAGSPIKSVTIIDFENKIVYDKKVFVEHSMNLLDQYLCVQKWYEA